LFRQHEPGHTGREEKGVIEMERVKTMCTEMEERLADLLLDPASAPASVRQHVDSCPACARELAILRATMGALDAWQAPEPNPYFLTRIEARLREARDEAPRGWLGRLHDRLLFGSRTHLRPVAATALTLLLLVGGGAYLGISDLLAPANPPDQTAAVVHDMQNMDSNAQLLDQLEQLSSNDSTEQP
jgi:anti-sigma factor RsiW